MGVIKFSLNATRSVLLQFWWEYLLLVGFKDGEYYILKSPPNAGLRLDWTAGCVLERMIISVWQWECYVKEACGPVSVLERGGRLAVTVPCTS